MIKHLVWILALSLSTTGLAAQTSSVGSITTASTDCSTAGSCVAWQSKTTAVVGGTTSTSPGAAVIQLSGSFTGTVNFEVTADGRHWVPASGTPFNSTTAVASATAAGAWQFSTAGAIGIRARASILSNGQVNVTIQSSGASARNRGGTGGGATIASTTKPLKGDNSGNGVASDYSDIVGLWNSCTGFLKNDGTCGLAATTATKLSTDGTDTQVWGMSGTTQQWIDAAGGGTVTVKSSGSLTDTAIMTGAGGTQSQTPAATATMDASGNISTPGSVTATGGFSSAADGTHPGIVSLAGNTTLPSLPANTVSLIGFPAATNTAWSLQVPTAIPTTGHILDVTVTGTNALIHDSGIATATVAKTIASGTATINPGAVTNNTCTTAIDGGTATGVLTTDVVSYTPNADPTGYTGWGVSATGALLNLYAYPTADHVNFKVCNSTSGSITPTSMTVNWRVSR